MLTVSEEEEKKDWQHPGWYEKIWTDSWHDWKQTLLENVGEDWPTIMAQRWSLSRLQRWDMWANIVFVISVISWLVCGYECTAKLDWIGPHPFPSPQQTFHRWAKQLAHLWQLIWYKNGNGNQEVHTWQWTGTAVAYMWQLFRHTKGTEMAIKRSRNW